MVADPCADSRRHPVARVVRRGAVTEPGVAGEDDQQRQHDGDLAVHAVGRTYATTGPG